jgi:SEC-C motif-containing protein
MLHLTPMDQQKIQKILDRKARAETAEELLHARYLAFTKNDIDFIVDTHHPKTRGDVKREEVSEWAKNSEWMGLTVHQKLGGEASDTQGQIVFLVKYKSDGKEHDHWEHSFFEKDGGEWKFLDGQPPKTGPLRRTEPKVGRNDPCSCGSGKKFKKCCALSAEA